MGIAILWIVWFHTLSFNPFLIGNLLTFFKSIGYFGVDIFLFLSGFGLITGWVNKQYTITAFYKRRLLRIMPAYWVVLSGGLLGKILLGQEYRVSIAEFFCFGILFHFKVNFHLWFADVIVGCYIARFLIMCYTLQYNTDSDFIK
jgi:peptidoglycan/LPS O-acetylase OafA/YrhL